MAIETSQLAQVGADPAYRVVETKALALKMRAELIEIKNQISYDQAASFLLAIKQYRAVVADLFDPQIESAHKAHKTALAQKARFEEPLLHAEKIFRHKMSDYIIEQKRLEDERKRMAEEEAREKEAQVKQDLEREARELEATGATEEAAEVRQAVKDLFVPPAPVTPAVEQPAGISAGKEVDYEVAVVEPMDLIKALADGRVAVPDLSKLITWKISPLKDIARQTKGAPIPGCELKEKTVIKTGGKG